MRILDLCPVLSHESVINEYHYIFLQPIMNSLLTYEYKGNKA